MFITATLIIAALAVTWMAAREAFLMAWLTSHLASALGGPLLGILGHSTATLAGILKERLKAGEVEAVEDAAVQRASYKGLRSDWEHLVVILSLLALDVAGYLRGWPDPLIHSLNLWAGMSVAWFFGHLITRRLK